MLSPWLCHWKKWLWIAFSFSYLNLELKIQIPSGRVGWFIRGVRFPLSGPPQIKVPPTPSCLGDRKTYLNFVISHEAIVYVSLGPPLTSQPCPVSTHERQPLKIYSQIPILPASSFSFEAGEGIASSLPLSRQTAGWERCKVGTGREFVMSSTTVSGKCQGHPPNQNQRYPRPFSGLSGSLGHALVNSTWTSSHTTFGMVWPQRDPEAGNWALSPESPQGPSSGSNGEEALESWGRYHMKGHPVPETSITPSASWEKALQLFGQRTSAGPWA